jgi:salicylate hydroxylase
VLEQADEIKEIGAGIQLAPNALRLLGDLGVLDAVYADAVFPPQAVLMNAVTGNRITALDFGPAFQRAYKAPYIVTHRADLHSSLLRACRESGLVTFETDRRVCALSETDSSVLAVTADGSRYQADALIGADGLHSVVRAYVVGDGPPVVSHDVAYRGLSTYIEAADRDGKDNVTWWVGPKMHFIQYPVRHRELFNQVAVFVSDHYQPGVDAWGTPTELDERFADKHELVRRGVSLIDRTKWWLKAPVKPWRMVSCLPAPSQHTDSMGRRALLPMKLSAFPALRACRPGPGALAVSSMVMTSLRFSGTPFWACVRPMTLATFSGSMDTLHLRRNYFTIQAGS